jgi:hypothetical protein
MLHVKDFSLTSRKQRLINGFTYIFKTIGDTQQDYCEIDSRQTSLYNSDKFLINTDIIPRFTIKSERRVGKSIHSILSINNG